MSTQEGSTAEGRRWLRRRGRLVLAGVVAALAIAGVPAAWATFFDVPPSNPFYTDINAIQGAGITTGCGGGNFCPLDNITRQAEAAFVHRGLGRVGWSHTLFSGGTTPAVGQGSFDPRTVGTVTIQTGGPSGGTQFVSLHGKLSLFTNSTFATYCTAPTCSWRIGLQDNANPGIVNELDDAIWRPLNNSDASTMSLDAVVAVPTNTLKSYSLIIWYEGTIAANTFTKWDFSLTAETSAFGHLGGNSLGSGPAGAAGSPSSQG